jgi:hypothetical protein
MYPEIEKYIDRLIKAASNRSSYFTSAELDELFIPYAQIYPGGASTFSKGCHTCVFDMIDTLVNYYNRETAKSQQQSTASTETAQTAAVAEEPKKTTRRKKA